MNTLLQKLEECRQLCLTIRDSEEIKKADWECDAHEDEVCRALDTTKTLLLLSQRGLEEISKLVPKIYPNVYFNSRQNRKDFYATLDIVNKVIDKALKVGGGIFGGFVRNVMIPVKYNMPVVGYKDVDVWFKTQTCADAFIKSVNDSDINVELIMHQEKMGLGNGVFYPFERQQYMLKKKTGENLVIFDVIVSKILPVNDFNVNQLVYEYQIIPKFVSYGYEKDDELIDAIKNKKARTLPGYSKSLYNNDVFWVQTKRLDTMIQIGWEITNPGQDSHPYLVNLGKHVGVNIHQLV